MSTQRDRARRLVDKHGRTFAAEASITLRDKPAPLWQLLVLTLLLSTRISADIALATARELFSAGWRTPQRLRKSTWQQRVDALGRLRDEGEADSSRLSSLLQEFTGIGPTGAHVFLREVQAVWPQVRPHVDPLVRKGAEAAELPEDAQALAGLVDDDEIAALAA